MFMSSELFEFMFIIIFVIVIGGFVFTIVKGLSEWNNNNHSPLLTVDARVVSKRMNVSHHQHANAGDATGAHGYHTTSSTNYYVTFQVASGNRMEFHVKGREYVILVEGDQGKLSFQGSRYLGFKQ